MLDAPCIMQKLKHILLYMFDHDISLFYYIILYKMKYFAIVPYLLSHIICITELTKALSTN